MARNKTHNHRKVARLQRGQLITGRHLSHMADAINANTRFLSGPRQQTALDASEAESNSESAGAGLTDLDFTEVTRSSTTVTQTDSGGDTHDLGQIDTVQLANSAGEIMTLTFNNP